MTHASTIKDIGEQVSRLMAQKTELEKKIGGLQEALAHFESLPEEHPPKSNAQGMVDAIHGKLIEAGEPLHRKDIFDFLVRNGFHVNGQQPLGNMTAHMSLDARFESVGEGKWGLVAWNRKPKAMDYVMRGQPSQESLSRTLNQHGAPVSRIGPAKPKDLTP